MWELLNRTRYKAERTWVQDKNGAKHWVVVVKGTFDIDARGTVALAEAQVDPLQAPEYRGKDGLSSLRYEADMIGGKPGTDVYVDGHARAPGGRPVTQMSVGLRIRDGQLKVLDVTGDRVFERELGGVVPSRPMPFVEMPITYERAFGGFDAENPDPAQQKMFAPNPVGTGVASAARLVGRPVANLALAGGRRNDRACGFGAICSYWSPRIDYGGTYDGKWVTARKPLLPVDFDPRFFMCAPADQQFVPHLTGGERIEVANMTANGTLGFAIPKVYIACETRISTREKPVRHRCFLNTVIVEPDHPRVQLVWHTSIPCHHDMDYLEHTVIREKAYI
jgi:hypothetical protein